MYGIKNMNSIKTSAKGWWLRGSDKVLLVSAVLDYEICLFLWEFESIQSCTFPPPGVSAFCITATGKNSMYNYNADLSI